MSEPKMPNWTLVSDPSKTRGGLLDLDQFRRKAEKLREGGSRDETEELLGDVEALVKEIEALSEECDRFKEQLEDMRRMVIQLEELLDQISETADKETKAAGLSGFCLGAAAGILACKIFG